MSKRTIAFTVENGLCISCGVCKGICPKDCIRWSFREGMYCPVIDSDQCVECGLCSQVCPGVQMDFSPAESVETSMEGNALETFNAWSTDPQKRHYSASGGVLSTLIPALLDLGYYDGVFCLDSYDYTEQLRSQYQSSHDFHVEWASSKIPKSRYLPVSHEDAVSYIRTNPDARLILVGTSCAIQGLTRTIAQLHRNRDQYLMIGLFCDKVFSYNIMSYYQQTKFCGEKKLTELHFKNKESGGWPGNLKFHFSDGSTCYHDKSHRMGLKEYFMPERCLYCIDKLNVMADISLGDNYTGISESPLGSNSVILRTERGQAAWHAVCATMEAHPISIQDIAHAQVLHLRAVNAHYALIKQKKVCAKFDSSISLNHGISVSDDHHMDAGYACSMAKLHSGAVYPEHPEEFRKQYKKAGKIPLRRKIRCLLSKYYHRLFGKG